MRIEQELIEQKLFELIESKDLSSLSVDEKSFILRQMDEVDYYDQRNALLVINEAEAKKIEAKPDQEIANKLFKEKNILWFEQITDLFRTKIPATTIAIPMLLLICFFIYQGSHSTKEQSHFNKTEAVISTLEDTLKSSISSINVSKNPYSKYVVPIYEY